MSQLHLEQKICFLPENLPAGSHSLESTANTAGFSQVKSENRMHAAPKKKNPLLKLAGLPAALQTIDGVLSQTIHRNVLLKLRGVDEPLKVSSFL